MERVMSSEKKLNSIQEKCIYASIGDLMILHYAVAHELEARGYPV